MSKAKLIAHILEVSERTIFRWKNEKKLIVQFLYNNFSDDDLLELINNRQIEKFVFLNEFSYMITEKIKEYEMKFIFSIGHFGIEFIDILYNLFDGKILINQKSNIHCDSFHYEISKDNDYLKYLNFLFDTKFEYLYNKLDEIIKNYPDDIIKEFFEELKNRINQK